MGGKKTNFSGAVPWAGLLISPVFVTVLTVHQSQASWDLYEATMYSAWHIVQTLKYKLMNMQVTLQ